MFLHLLLICPQLRNNRQFLVIVFIYIHIIYKSYNVYNIQYRKYIVSHYNNIIALLAKESLASAGRDQATGRPQSGQGWLCLQHLQSPLAQRNVTPHLCRGNLMSSPCEGIAWRRQNPKSNRSALFQHCSFCSQYYPVSSDLWVKAKHDTLSPLFLIACLLQQLCYRLQEWWRRLSMSTCVTNCYSKVLLITSEKCKKSF